MTPRVPRHRSWRAIDRPARVLALLSLLAAGACARRAPAESELAAVYDAFLYGSRHDFDGPVLLQDVTSPVTVAMLDFDLDTAVTEISRELSSETRRAMADLVARSRTSRRLPADVQVARSQRRIPADSARAILQRVRGQNLHRLPDRAQLVLLSDVGFSRDGSVAVVAEQVVCGSECGGWALRAVRRHPAGWISAEELLAVVY
jgi:hypothetical protein